MTMVAKTTKRLQKNKRHLCITNTITNTITIAITIAIKITIKITIVITITNAITVTIATVKARIVNLMPSQIVLNPFSLDSTRKVIKSDVAFVFYECHSHIDYKQIKVKGYKLSKQD